jgi:hypothetical protein
MTTIKLENEYKKQNQGKEALASGEFEKEITVKGWVRTRRGNKNIAFIALNDGFTIKQHPGSCRCAGISLKICSGRSLRVPAYRLPARSPFHGQRPECGDPGQNQ